MCPYESACACASQLGELKNQLMSSLPARLRRGAVSFHNMAFEPVKNTGSEGCIGVDIVDVVDGKS